MPWRTRPRPRDSRSVLECGSPLYPLPTKNLVLCTVLLLMVRMLNASESAADWTESEFQNCELGDRRLVRRLRQLATDMARKPRATIPDACVSWTKTKAAYRFFDHPEMTIEQLLEGHLQATVQRMKEHRVVLAVQDTTTINYAAHLQTEGLGPTNRNANSGRGMLLHSTLAVTPEQIPLGILDAQMWSRDPAQHGKNHQRNRKAIDQKESRKWLDGFQSTARWVSQCPNTKLVNVADREGDIYELLAAALQPGAPGLLVRMMHNRQIAQSDQALLWEHMARQPVAQIVAVDLPRSPSIAARRARCEIRFGPVQLKAPTIKAGKPGLSGVWFIEIREISTPPGKIEPVLWRLLTTLPVENLEQAMEKVRWYLIRWQIEVFHRTLKTGCAVESLELETINRLKLAVGLKMIIAWHITALVHGARTEPQAPASAVLPSAQIVVLLAVTKMKVTAQSLTLQEAMRAIAGLGGFLGRKHDGEPGALTLWRGIQRLNDMVAAVSALQNVGNG